MKKKSGDDSPRAVSMQIRRTARFEAAMFDAFRLHATLVALLTAASAVNGVMFYHYL